MTTSDIQQPVILLSPPEDDQPSKSSFLKRKLSNLSLRKDVLFYTNSCSITATNTIYSSSSNLSTPSSISERARPSIVLQDKYKNYKLGKKIGSGASAKLRLLEPTKGNKLVAMKIYKKKEKDETEKGYDKQLTSEFCISKTLFHQHVVSVYDLLKDKKGRWCITMEYCAGGDLLSVIQQFDLNDDEMDCLFKQLLLGLSHIHSSGVAHRDIKPENLIMTTDGLLKIGDFGVADVVQSCFDLEPRYSKGKCGSEPYWSPEILTSTEYDAKALDIWSSAVTWHVMLYRRIPFLIANQTDPSYIEFLKAKRDWLPLSKCSEQEKECLFGMFDPDPNTRWTIERCLRSDWISSIGVCFENFKRHRHHFIKNKLF
ncbi:hypothetical protein G6F57_009675 [Rhizopus arrhizus]|uniref:non-specific serine/threonine protein kinase n=1 Tax=Rhizopus oryzae TaxID=64495 RepID=A0A9P7BP79_RHIOR|nr:hypothetical protein G6F23_008543 [Rhizopus arrhizus]KAG1415324.1 hypothetical protein G6F58_006538 [Rhizopus delemar]KAG0769123.1 hypothetical protein G6F24_001347 [Rhizopus arrhizus]KAG0912713.1 hypothetical protein G6F33_005838 [Rhizopus arrhizus]KAG0941227.1 hypothetical protein G6F30_006315 [Rhizopus arrhizus]